MAVSSKVPVVAIASIMHESNSFNPEATTLERFTFRQGDTPEDMLRIWSAGSTEVAGMIEEGNKAGWQFIPILYASATPAGPVAPEAFEILCGRLVSGLSSAGPVDGVLLALHGAMFTPEFPQADEEITRRVREAIGPDTPLVVTHDFHANISPGMTELTSALLTYQQNPHTDTHGRGVRAARILKWILETGRLPEQVILKPPVLWNIAFQNTSQEPLAPITAASIALEANAGVLAASVAGGYQYNDVPHMGPSVVVVTDGVSVDAAREAQTLADMLWNGREATRLHLPDAATAVREAIAAEKFPVALFDMGDNIGGGSAGDETTILSELLRQGASGWVVVLFDPEAVQQAKTAGIEGRFEAEVGGKSPGTHGKPVRIAGKVRSLGTGRFVEPAVRHGGHRYWNMGHNAVIELEGSTPDELSLVLLTSLPCAPFSLHQLTSCGIYPERQKILVVKGVVAPRAAYEPIAAKIVLVDTPGMTSVNPSHFQFRRARPDLWGLTNE